MVLLCAFPFAVSIALVLLNLKHANTTGSH